MRDKRATMQGATGVARPRRSGQALAHQLAPLFEAGRLPQDVAAQSAVSEADAWRGFGAWLRARAPSVKGLRKMPTRFYRLRLQRLRALMDAGLSQKEAAGWLGVHETVLQKDSRRLADIPPLPDLPDPDAH